MTQLAKEPRILDGDNGLVGEVLNQLYLFVGERPYLLAINSDRANQFIVLKHWNAEHCPSTRELSELRAGIAGGHIQIFWALQDIGNLNRLFYRQRPSECCCWSRSDYWIPLPLL